MNTIVLQILTSFHCVSELYRIFFSKIRFAYNLILSYLFLVSCLKIPQPLIKCQPLKTWFCPQLKTDIWQIFIESFCRSTEVPKWSNVNKLSTIRYIYIYFLFLLRSNGTIHFFMTFGNRAAFKNNVMM